MKNKILLCLLFNLFTFLAHSQPIEEFSDLSSSSALLFNSAATSSGIVYFINNASNNKLVKLDYQGEIILEKELPFTDNLYYTGQLTQGEEKLYLVGHQRLFPDGTNDQAVWNSQKRSILEFDDNLNITNTYLFETVPFGAGEVKSTSGTYVSMYNPTSVAEVNGEIAALWPYAIFDTNDNISIIGRTQQLEFINLQKNETVVSQLTNVTLNLGAVFLDEEILVYGETADTILPSGVAINLQPLSLYNRNGELLELLSFDQNSSGAFGDGSAGQLMDDKIFSAYYGRNVSANGCTDNTATIDIRNLNFELINITKVPDCEVYPIGKDPFAFTDDNHLYFSAINEFGNTQLFKYDLELNYQWDQLLELEGERPISLKATPSGGVILECFKLDGNDSQIKLYAFAANGDIVAVNKLPLHFEQSITFGPNPTQDYIYPFDSKNQSTLLHIYSMQGQLVERQIVTNDGVNLASLPTGQYWLQSYDAIDQQLIGLQKIVKL